jgi:hypothetical protein
VKNLPHQFNQLATLKAVLATARDLGARTGNSGDFGYELAGRGTYKFRNLTTSLADRIAQERLKPADSQGALTTARELRRLLTDLGFLQGSPSWSLTAEGTALLGAPAGSAAEVAIWQSAFTRLAVTDRGGNTSHPGCIMLRLLADTGGLPRHSLGLALQPADDSEVEYKEALALVGLDPPARRAALGINPATDANSVKILPTIAEQAGLVIEAGGTYRLTAAGTAALAVGCSTPGSGSTGKSVVSGSTAAAATAAGSAHGLGSGTPGAGKGTITHARRWADRPAGLEPGGLDEATFKALTADEQSAAARLRKERTTRHNAAVETLAGLGTKADVDLHEDPVSFDLVVESVSATEDLVLVEVKTVDEDVDVQARRAIGQLYWYRYRVVGPRWPGRKIELVAVFDGPVPPHVVEVFDALNIGVGVLEGGVYKPINDAAERTAPRFAK